MAEQNQSKGDAAAIVQAVKELHNPQLMHVPPDGGRGVGFLVVPRGMDVKSVKPLLDEYREVPERKTGVTTLTSLDAFCAFVNRQRTSDSIVFMDDTNAAEPVLRAVFNPHKAEAVSKPEDGIGPDNGDHGAIYKFPLSEEWKAWTAIGKADFISQVRFAAFLEDRIGDVSAPDAVFDNVKDYAEKLGFSLASPAKLLELSRGLAVTVNAKVVQVLNLSTGEGQVTFAEEHGDSKGAPLKFPGAFGINIPVFRLGGAFNVPVRLRYRRGDTAIVWSLAPQWLDKVFELALEDATLKVQKACELPVFRGAP